MYYKRIWHGIITMVIIINAVWAGVRDIKNQLNMIMGDDIKDGGKLIYVNNADGFIYFVDFSAVVLSDKRVQSDVTPVISPLISPDGSMVVYWTGDEDQGDIYACKLQENATSVMIGTGYDPHWWIDPASKKTYVIYSTATGKLNWPQFGATMKQEIDPSTFNKIGSPVTLLDRSFNGGLSKNGRYLCTAYESTDMYDLTTSTHFSMNNGLQSCNASITPSVEPDSQNQMLHLSLGNVINGVTYRMHEVFMKRDSSDSLLWYSIYPPGTEEWQKPEWSTHPDYAVATAKRGGAYHVYIVMLEEGGAQLWAVDGGNYTYPHMWLAYGGSSVKDFRTSFGQDNMALNISPNPAGRTITIAWGRNATGKHGLITVDIYNVQGDRVETLQARNQAESLVWEAGDQGPGIYLILFKTSTQTVSRRILLSQ